MRAAILLCALLSSPALAQSSRLILNGEVQERFIGTTQVSGQRIVGVVAGSLTGLPDIGRLRLGIPASRTVTPICVTAVSRDSTFTAIVPILAKPGMSATELLPARTRSPDRLRGYGATDVAIRVALGTACNQPSGRRWLVPSYSGTTERVVVFLQGRGARRASITVNDDKGNRSQTQCQRDPAKVSRAFDFECNLLLDGLYRHGSMNMNVVFIERSGTRTPESVELLWP